MKKRRIFNTAIIALLSVVLCFCGCNRGSNNGGGFKATEKATYNGTHILTAPEINGEWLVRDGATEYVLVTSEDASSFAKEAKDEFIHLFRIATGISVTVKSDAEALPAGQKYISLGKTRLFTENAAINDKAHYDEVKLGTYGVRLITHDKNIYLLAGKDHGLCQAVYAFMRTYFNFEEYYRNCYDIDKNVCNAKLRAFDITDIPDLPLLIADNRYYDYYTTIGTDALAGMTDRDAKSQRARLGYSDRAQEHLMPLIGSEAGHSAYYHNSQHYLDTDWSEGERGENYVKFDNWFPKTATNPDGLNKSGLWQADSGQLCYNAHGDPDAYEALVNQCSAAVIESMKARPREQYPNLNIIMFTQMDGFPPCACETCTRKAQEDGATDSGSQIRLMNRMSANVRKWMDEKDADGNYVNEAYRRDDFVIMNFSYAYTATPPATIGANGKVTVNNESCKMSEGVGTFHAPNFSLNFGRSIYDSYNDEGRENIIKWASMTDHLWLWTYGSYHQLTAYVCDALSFFDNDLYAFLSSVGVECLFDEAQDYGDGVTGWANFKNYVQAKLAWNCNTDVSELKEKFFARMYGPAAEEMKEAYLAQRLHTNAVMAKNEWNDPMISYDAAAVLGNSECFPLNTLQGWIAIFDRALEKIEPYKTLDEDLYNVYKSRIEMETMSPLYTVYLIYGRDQALDADLLARYKNRMYEEVRWYPNFLGSAGGSYGAKIADIFK